MEEAIVAYLSAFNLLFYLYLLIEILSVDLYVSECFKAFLSEKNLILISVSLLKEGVMDP